MKTQKQDRRSQRTHQLLAAALVDLLHERRYGELTVQDILDRANVGRTTFYAHYWDKDDLLASEMERVIALLCNHIAPSNGADGLPLPSLAMFRHVAESAALIRALTSGQAMALIWTTVQSCLREEFIQHFHQRLSSPVDEMALRVTAQAVVGTFITLLQWWVEQEMPLSPETMDAYFQRLTLPGVRAVLGAAND
ncbi:MAG: TetR/AcrR family transcriptional regulator [Ktedonobacterales bacterium]|nr:TetR/AcrR family transcriptional regulator [Ktedonobacterales bacterium]